jgi:hypothetical protein
MQVMIFFNFTAPILFGSLAMKVEADPSITKSKSARGDIT